MHLENLMKKSQKKPKTASRAKKDKNPCRFLEFMDYEITGTLSGLIENVPIANGYHRYTVLDPKKPKAVQLEIDSEQGMVYQMFYGQTPSFYLGKEVTFKETIGVEGTKRRIFQFLEFEGKTLEGRITLDIAKIE
jgi:hypothetical protein